MYSVLHQLRKVTCQSSFVGIALPIHQQRNALLIVPSAKVIRSALQCVIVRLPRRPTFCEGWRNLVIRTAYENRKEAHTVDRKLDKLQVRTRERIDMHVLLYARILESPFPQPLFRKYH